MSSKIIKDKIQIYVRYRLFDDDGEVCEVRWLGGRRIKAERWSYNLRVTKGYAIDWLGRYNGDREKAMDMGRKLAQIVKVGRHLLEEGWVYDLYMVRKVTRLTEVSLSDNPMVVLAVSAMG